MEEEDRYRRRGGRRGSPDERDDRRRRYSPDRNRRNGKNDTNSLTLKHPLLIIVQSYIKIKLSTLNEDFSFYDRALQG